MFKLVLTSKRNGKKSLENVSFKTMSVILNNASKLTNLKRYSSIELYYKGNIFAKFDSKFYLTLYSSRSTNSVLSFFDIKPPVLEDGLEVDSIETNKRKKFDIIESSDVSRIVFKPSHFLVYTFQGLVKVNRKNIRKIETSAYLNSTVVTFKISV